MSMESAAKETELLNLLAAFSGSPITDATVDAYIGAVDAYTVEAVALACRRFIAGDVPGQNKAYRPSAAELVEQVRIFANAIRFREGAKEERAKLVSYRMGEEPPPPMVALGPVEVDFGQGPIDMRDMTPAEKEFVLTHKRRPDPDAKIEAHASVLPRLQRMGE